VLTTRLEVEAVSKEQIGKDPEAVDKELPPAS